MLTFLRAAVLVAVSLGVTAAHASHTPELTRAEERCQRALGSETDLLGAREARCIATCDRSVCKGSVPATDCLPPFGGRTRACVDAAKAAAAARIDRACRRDCPDCYTGGCTAYRAGAIAATEGVVDSFARPILCDDATSPDGLTAAEARCRLGVARVLAQAAVAFGRCVVGCREREVRNKAAPGSCTGEMLGDARARTCMNKLKAKTRGRLEAACADAPECLAPVLPTIPDRLEAQIYADYRLFIFCASPSGAFLD